VRMQDGLIVDDGSAVPLPAADQPPLAPDLYKRPEVTASGQEVAV